ncbi:bacteriohopanetetrol glucosamine biosynthesis glycosyltransferase HpnI [Geobacter grbiciae]|uniref:bacteriohopanetetrol glucosamine biosynthesis glycosyltransferase HpnI n=1 Tax=Geobacter grbiciae TaxID=155042 RepID=UPI001C011DEA|nr:bacteriohopanetetrol glucosamine biosynthesis glycosyltransferase HpnI [Geobacter grbiciae]MBT1076958.1 bacteriohopanetetrol glucosamine biosynthesis glycosyltransferase HpnI [Geobacter grbiciae]
MLTTVLPFLCILPPLAYGVISLGCARSYFGRRRPAPGHTPPISILKPVKGMDAGSFDNFASFCRQEYPAPVQIIFACADAADPVIPVIGRLMAEFPAIDMDLVVDATLYGPNHKVSNLINAFPRAKHELLIVCDSDIRVSPDYLREVAAPFADQQVGLVTSLYRSPGVAGAATAVEAMGFTVEMIPNVMVAMKLEGLSFALGASMAVRREALESIGGFPALADYLADDYQLGNKVHKAGWRLELSDCFVESVMHREDLATVLSRQLRWSRTMRVSRPGGYLGSGITQSFPMACLALALSGLSGAGWGAVLLLYLVRAAVAMAFSRCYVKDGIFPRWLWLLPLRDFLAFATWALSFAGNRVRWRGNLFRLLPGGKIVELPKTFETRSNGATE